MNAATIAGLVIALGPAALDLIPQLAAIWAKKELTAEEVAALCAPAKKSYDQYIIEARVRMAALSPAHHCSMKTWKAKRTVCRSRKSGKFAGKMKCGMFKRTKVKAAKSGFLFS